MASAHDVAAYILREAGPMDTWKLQKLVCYSQAWHLVWEGEPLFQEPIEAWANGPVIYGLYNEHRGQFTCANWPKGKIGNLKPKERESIDVVLKYYGRYTGFTLREWTHQEPPWKAARERSGKAPGERSNEQITLGDLSEYYGSL